MNNSVFEILNLQVLLSQGNPSVKKFEFFSVSASYSGRVAEKKNLNIYAPCDSPSTYGSGHLIQMVDLNNFPQSIPGSIGAVAHNPYLGP